MKKGDYIECRDLEDLKRTLRDLSDAGYHAVRDSYNNLWICITGTPEIEYLVEARDQNGRSQKAYCDTLEEAEDAAAEFGNGYEYVDILKGYPGEWEVVNG